MAKSYKIVRRNRPTFNLNVPCNVKVKGERTMRKGVVLVQHPTDPTMVLVRTGHRGRPANLPVADVERVRVLAS